MKEVHERAGRGRNFASGRRSPRTGGWDWSCCGTRGDLCVRSATCPHLGGIVAWNAAEKTWDCPLHGSRFDRCGKMINGPSNGDLETV